VTIIFVGLIGRTIIVVELTRLGVLGGRFAPPCVDRILCIIEMSEGFPCPFFRGIAFPFDEVLGRSVGFPLAVDPFDFMFGVTRATSQIAEKHPSSLGAVQSGQIFQTRLSKPKTRSSQWYMARQQCSQLDS
jgi:hypothetical protein